jgi:invasion protein IalB
VVKLGHKTAAEEDMKKPGAAATEDDQKPRSLTYMSCSRETCAATASVKKNPTS